MNDTKHPQQLFLHSLRFPLPLLNPQDHTIIEVSLADDQAVFIKTKGNRVLVGK